MAAVEDSGDSDGGPRKARSVRVGGDAVANLETIPVRSRRAATGESEARWSITVLVRARAKQSITLRLGPRCRSNRVGGLCGSLAGPFKTLCRFSLLWQLCLVGLALIRGAAETGGSVWPVWPFPYPGAAA